METYVLRTSTNTDVYIDWNSFTPFTWKHNTLKTLVYCGYIVCSDKHNLKYELKYLRNVSGCNWTQTQNHSVHKRTLNHLELCSEYLSFGYELSGSGFEFSCSHLNFRFRTCFKQGIS